MDFPKRKVREIDRFLSELSAAWIPVRDAATLIQVTADAVAQHLSVDRVTFAAITPDAIQATVEFSHSYNETHVTGTFSLGDYLSQAGLAELIEGRPVEVTDVTTDSRTAFARDKFQEFEVGAFVIVPLLSDMGLASILSINTTAPRVWRSEEIQLLEHVAARLWPAVERARAEDALRKSEQRHEFLLRLFDALQPLNDPFKIMEVTTRLLGEHLNVNRVNFTEIEGSTFIVRQSYAKGVAPAITQGPVALFGAALQESYRRGEPITVPDVATDPRLTEEEQAGLLARQIAAYAGVMMLKNGKWVAVFNIQNSTPRDWTPEELGLVREIGERTWESIQKVQFEAALREREQRLRLALEASGGGSWTWDACTNRVYWDDRFRTLYGFTPEDQPAVDAWPSRVHEEDRPRLMALFNELMKSKTMDSWDNSFRIVRPDGKLRWIQSLGHAERDSTGRISRLSGLELDISERRRAEEADLARRDEEHDRTLRLLLETATQGILSMDAGGTIVTANRALEKMFGWEPGELVGKTLESLLPLNLRDRHAGHRTAYFSAPAARIMGANLSLLGQRKDGSTFPIETSLNHVATQSGGYAIAFVTDISARNQAEEELRRSHAELEQRTNQLSRLASDLTLAEQNTREQLARTLHDGLQQLLFSAALRLNRLTQRGALGTAEAELLAQAQTNIDNAISASRSLSVELFPAALHGTGLPSAVTWLADWMREKYGLEVHVNVDPLANSERRDVRTLVFESLRELLFNAVKHAKVDRVAVELALGPDKTLHVTVTDQGIGFDAASLFNRNNNQRLGLGLFSIRERLMLLGGQLEVESSPGRGTRFLLVAPLGVNHGPVSANIASDVDTFEHVPDTTISETSSRLLRILIADDHTAVREGLREMLLDRPEFLVVGEATNGLEAIAQARSLRPDVIVMDISMPRMDGIEATRRIHAELPFIQIFGLSAHERTENLHAIRRAGGSDYFIKGAEMHRLIERLLSLRSEKISLRRTAT